ncbi:MAG: type II secretion system protein [Erysipelotrichia bacterium]|nr:type II secretion system protein [Erysipelotrichia bacterium]
MVKKIDKKAFTLIEVLVVVAIIGILALLTVPRFIGQTQKAELVRI